MCIFMCKVPIALIQLHEESTTPVKTEVHETRNTGILVLVPVILVQELYTWNSESMNLDGKRYQIFNLTYF